MYHDSIFTEFISVAPTDKESALVKVMHWHRTGGKSSSEPMLAKMSDAIWRYGVTMRWLVDSRLGHTAPLVTNLSWWRNNVIALLEHYVTIYFSSGSLLDCMVGLSVRAAVICAFWSMRRRVKIKPHMTWLKWREYDVHDALWPLVKSISPQWYPRDIFSYLAWLILKKDLFAKKKQYFNYRR